MLKEFIEKLISLKNKQLHNRTGRSYSVGGWGLVPFPSKPRRKPNITRINSLFQISDDLVAHWKPTQKIGEFSSPI